jgi:hypothetical protein
MKFSIIYEAQMVDPSTASEVRCFKQSSQEAAE